MNTLSPAPSSLTDFALHTLQGESMGTSWCVKLVAAQRVNLHALHAGIQSQLDLVVAQMSTWEVDSDISRFNRLPANTWQSLPQPFFDILSCAMRIASESDGAYDPTVGPLVEAWGFGTAAHPQVPDMQAISHAQSRIGWQHVVLQSESRSALQPGNFHLDLSAIAKGYSVDAIVLYLRSAGIPGALVEVGGELYGYGRKPDKGLWQVLVETSPDEEQENNADNPARILALDGMAVATSGDHWHVFEHEGTSYSHTLDPRTGQPVQYATAAVTVIADDTMHADAWATALTVMGGHAGFEFAQARGLAARFVMRGNDGLVEHMTDAFLARLLR